MRMVTNTLLVGDLLSKYVSAVSLREQMADSICNAHHEWILVQGVANFLLTDQGSNVDGDVKRQIWDKFGIERHRTSGYHSPGKGYAERSIHNVKEVFRTHLLSNNLHANMWRPAGVGSL